MWPFRRPRAQRVTAPSPDTGGRSFWVRVPGAEELQVGHDEALRLSAVWACVSVIAKALASCDWSVFAEDRQGNRTPRRDTATWFRLNVRPNDEMTAYAFREALLTQALIYGNGYAEIERTSGGAPAALWPLDPDRTSIERDTAGNLVAVVRNYGRADTVLPYADLFHVHGPSVDGIAGYDTVTMALKGLAHAYTAELFGLSYFANGGGFGMKLKVPGTLTPEQRKSIRDDIRVAHTGPEKRFGVFFAEGGGDLEPLTVNNEEAQFLETRVFIVQEICRWFGVPPHKVAELSRSTFSNIEHQGLEFVRDALTPWCERLRQEADWKLLPGAGVGLRTRIDTEWLAEGDAASKATVDAALFRSGLMTINEIRRRRGLNTVPASEGGDTLFVQGQMIPVAAAAGGAASEPAPADPALPPPAMRLDAPGNGHLIEH